jgi:hypothetical protein
MYPTIAKYNQTIHSRGSQSFKTLSNLVFLPSRTVPFPIYSYGSGSYAVVFKAKEENAEIAIRCFISAESENIERYRQIDRYLKNATASWITKVELLEEEITVDRQSYPVIKMEWVEGQLLNKFINQNINNNEVLTEIQNEIINLSKSLEILTIGHGDIQCGNVIIVKSSTGKPVIKLIDYDGMYIPSFKNKSNLERGRSEFQHPFRSQVIFNEKIDRFSFWVIICAIEALKFDKTLWREIMNGGFNSLDNLLFSGDDFKSFNSSRLVNKLYSLNKPSLTFYLDKLNKFCNEAPENVEPPVICGEHAIIDLTSSLPKVEYSINEVEINSYPIGAAVLTSTYQRIGETPVRIQKEEYLDRKIFITYGTEIQSFIINNSTTKINLVFREYNQSPANSLPMQPVDSTGLNREESSNLLPVQQIGNDESNNFGWIFFGVMILLISLLISYAIFNNQNSTTNSSFGDSDFSSYSTTTDTTVAVMDTMMPIMDTADYIVTPAPIANDFKDDYGNTAEEIVNIFFSNLNRRDCLAAWNISYVPTWEANGLDWFCSSNGFGGISKVIVYYTYSASQQLWNSEIHISYLAEDIYLGTKCYKQIILVEKRLFVSTYRWMIVDIQDMEEPVYCSS